jgi:hypothetical protein
MTAKIIKQTDNFERTNEAERAITLNKMPPPKTIHPVADATEILMNKYSQK